MAKLFANMSHSAAYDLHLHSLSIIIMAVSRLKWVKGVNPDQTEEIV